MMWYPILALLLGSFWKSPWKSSSPALSLSGLQPVKPPFLQSLYPFRNHSNEETVLFAVRQVPGDGSCLFHSLSAWLAFVGRADHVDFDRPMHTLSRLLRQLAVDTLELKNCTFHIEDGETMESEAMLRTAAEYHGVSVREYCASMRLTKTWGGGPEIVALCHHLKCPIFVYELSTKGFFPFKKYCLKMFGRYGYPAYKDKSPIHILNADGRFPHVFPGLHKKVGDHFLALFPCNSSGGEILSLADQIALNGCSFLDTSKCPLFAQEPSQESPPLNTADTLIRSIDEV